MSKARVLGLYRELLRTGGRFSDYNVREYARRKVQEEFRSKARLTDETQLSAAVKEAKDNLEIMRRQVSVYGLYQHAKNVIELEPKRQ